MLSSSWFVFLFASLRDSCNHLQKRRFQPPLVAVRGAVRPTLLSSLSQSARRGRVVRWGIPSRALPLPRVLLLVLVCKLQTPARGSRGSRTGFLAKNKNA